MTAAEMQRALATLRWTYRYPAELLGCDEKLVRRWACGEIAIPAAVADWLAECEQIASRVRFPAPPENWRVNAGYAPAPRRRPRAA
jgi:hypothetical protein